MDAWPWAREMPLTGWLERNAFHPIWAALLMLVVGFGLFQVVVAPLVGLLYLVIQTGRMPTMVELSSGFQADGGMMVTANSVGQFIGFALLAVAVARLHTPAWRDFLRARQAPLVGLVAAGLGWAALYPAVMWAQQLNAGIELPETLRTLEQMQDDMIEGLLLGNTLSTPVLLLAFAVTPAICEELFFRGYLQRQVERRWGTLASLLVVGIVFGAYHLRFSTLLPLSLLGVYLGFVVWATGSVWTGAFVHLLNNGLAVMLTSTARATPDFDPTLYEDAAVPWYFGVAGLIGAAALAAALVWYRRSVAGTREDAQPVALLPSSARLTDPS